MEVFLLFVAVSVVLASFLYFRPSPPPRVINMHVIGELDDMDLD